MEVIEEGPENIKILLKDSDRAYANALRRTLMSDTPKNGHRSRPISDGIIRPLPIVQSPESRSRSS